MLCNDSDVSSGEAFFLFRAKKRSDKGVLSSRRKDTFFILDTNRGLAQSFRKEYEGQMQETGRLNPPKGKQGMGGFSRPYTMISRGDEK